MIDQKTDLSKSTAELLDLTQCTSIDLVNVAPDSTVEMPELKPTDIPGRIGTFADYEIVRLIGRGGMGAVYEAIEPSLGRRVALKVLLPHLAVKHLGKSMFIYEAKALSSINCDHVVKIYRVGEENSLPFFAMELLQGKTLEGYLRNSNLKIAEIARIGRETAMGLEAVHEVGLVHRDVKPDNIWIEETGRVRLLDFGLAYSIGKSEKIHNFFGTPQYCSPEQLRKEAIDLRSDLFSLGAVLYRSVTGNHIYPGEGICDPSSIVNCQLINRDIPDDFAYLIHQLLSPLQVNRPNSAADVAQELLSISTNLLIQSGARNLVPIVMTESNYSLEASRRTRKENKPVKTQTFSLMFGILTFCVVVMMSFALISIKQRKSSQAQQNQITYQELFDTNTIKSIIPETDTPRWKLINKVYRAIPIKNVGDQFLLSSKQFKNFNLKLQYRWLTKGGHTSIWLISQMKDNNSSGTNADLIEGLRLNIGDDEGFPEVHKREIGDKYRTGIVEGINIKVKHNNKPIGEWNDLNVILNSNLLTVNQNNVQLYSINLEQIQNPGIEEFLNKEGFIGLQAHWGEIEYQNMLIHAE